MAIKYDYRSGSLTIAPAAAPPLPLPPAAQYYFETIFPRIPKKVSDEVTEELRKRGLPTAAKGNAGQVGALVGGRAG